LPRKTAQQANKDVLQFAPNFTAYVLSPDVVCLYSEDRKFFLHGELYCALVAAIGKNGCSVATLTDKLGRTFPPAKIDEAIKRLIERRYAIMGPPVVVNAVDGLWASLGLPGAVAGQNLQNCRVRIETIDVKGAAELSQALQHLGVRIVKTSPDLTVTLVNDYLDRRLAERNLERVSGKSAWLLVQPSGVFPLVGPIFKPGETACWT